MTTYDNTDRGVLFKNTDKRNENSPDYTGEINVKGTKQSLSAWVQTSKTGMKYLSLKVRDPLPPQETAPSPAPAPAPASAPTPPQQAMPQNGPIDDDIPF